MDEFTVFAELRPGDTLPDGDLADIRAEVFPGLQANSGLELNRDSVRGEPRAGRVLRLRRG